VTETDETRLCDVKTDDTRCDSVAEFNVTITCSGCPKSHRKGFTYVCSKDLNCAIKSNIVCDRCGTPQNVIDWIKLPVTSNGNADVRVVPPKTNYRIGDKQRNAVLDQLAEAFGGGFLTREEFDERANAVQTARNNADLIKITNDLLSSDNGKSPEHERTIADWKPQSFFLAGVFIGIVFMIILFIMLTTTT